MYDFQFSNPALTAWVLLYQAWSAMYRLEERQFSKLGLTPEQADVLWACGFHSGPVTPAEISRTIFRESQSVAGLLARMEKRGLARRIPKRKGHPFTEVQRTSAGEALTRPALESAMSFVEQIMACLSAKELEQLQKLLRKLRQNALEKLQIELRPPPGYASGETIDV